MAAQRPWHLNRAGLNYRRRDRRAECFDGAYQLMAYVGMDPTESESGESVASGKSMSKRAAADLRWALMQATDCVRRYDPYFGDYYANREG